MKLLITLFFIFVSHNSISAPYFYSMDYDQLRDIAIKTTSPGAMHAIDDLLEIRDNPTLKESVSRFTEDNYSFLEKAELGDKIASLVEPFVEAIAPFLSDEKKFFLANYLAWTYIYDDAITKLIDKLPKFISSILITRYTNRVKRVWNSALSDDEIPGKGYLLRFVSIYPPFDKLNRIVDSVFEQAILLKRSLISLNNEHLEIVNSSFFDSLDAIEQQYLYAPTSYDTYMERHLSSSGAVLFIHLSSLLLIDDRSPSEITKYYEILEDLRNSLKECTINVILANDSCACKDINGDDENLVSIIIKDKENLDEASIDTARKQGRVLNQYLKKRVGYDALNTIGTEIQKSFLRVTQGLEKIEKDHGSNDAFIFYKYAAIQWTFGYYFYNRYSKRYAPYFEMYLKAIDYDFEQYQNEFEQFSRENI